MTRPTVTAAFPAAPSARRTGASARTDTAAGPRTADGPAIASASGASDAGSGRAGNRPASGSAARNRPAAAPAFARGIPSPPPSGRDPAAGPAPGCDKREPTAGRAPGCDKRDPAAGRAPGCDKRDPAAGPAPTPRVAAPALPAATRPAALDEVVAAGEVVPAPWIPDAPPGCARAAVDASSVPLREEPAPPDGERDGAGELTLALLGCRRATATARSVVADAVRPKPGRPPAVAPCAARRSPGGAIAWAGGRGRDQDRRSATSAAPPDLPASGAPRSPGERRTGAPRWLLDGAACGLHHRSAASVGRAARIAAACTPQPLARPGPAPSERADPARAASRPAARPACRKRSSGTRSATNGPARPPLDPRTPVEPASGRAPRPGPDSADDLRTLVAPRSSALSDGRPATFEGRALVDPDSALDRRTLDDRLPDPPAGGRPPVPGCDALRGASSRPATRATPSARAPSPPARAAARVGPPDAPVRRATGLEPVDLAASGASRPAAPIAVSDPADPLRANDGVNGRAAGADLDRPEAPSPPDRSGAHGAPVDASVWRRSASISPLAAATSAALDADAPDAGPPAPPDTGDRSAPTGEASVRHRCDPDGRAAERSCGRAASPRSPPEGDDGNPAAARPPLQDSSAVRSTRSAVDPTSPPRPVAEPGDAARSSPSEPWGAPRPGDGPDDPAPATGEVEAPEDNVSGTTPLPACPALDGADGSGDTVREIGEVDGPDDEVSDPPSPRICPPSGGALRWSSDACRPRAGLPEPVGAATAPPPPGEPEPGSSAGVREARRAPTGRTGGEATPGDGPSRDGDRAGGGADRDREGRSADRDAGEDPDRDLAPDERTPSCGAPIDGLSEDPGVARRAEVESAASRRKWRRPGWSSTAGGASPRAAADRRALAVRRAARSGSVKALASAWSRRTSRAAPAAGPVPGPSRLPVRQPLASGNPRAGGAAARAAPAVDATLLAREIVPADRTPRRAPAEDAATRPAGATLAACAASAAFADDASHHVAHALVGTSTG
jgi:hypothetical protein